MLLSFFLMTASWLALRRVSSYGELLLTEIHYTVFRVVPEFSKLAEYLGSCNSCIIDNICLILVFDEQTKYCCASWHSKSEASS